MNLKEQLSINKEMAWQEINGQILILDSQVNESAHELNEMGSFIFSQIHLGKSPLEILEDLIQTFNSESSEEEIKKDFEGYLLNLINLQLLVPKNDECS
jgi:hypothetical protein